MSRLINKSAGNNVSNFNKADAFFNVDIVTTAGTKKLFGAPLSLSKEIQAMVINNADKFDKMKFEFSIHVVDNSATVELDLGEENTTEALKKAIAAA